MNSVSLIGNLTFKPELKKTQSGKSVVNITVAINRGYNREQVDFIPVIAWEKVAENVVNYLDKGSKVAVDGSLQSREYENKDGKRITVIEVVARNITFLSAPKQQNMFGSDYTLKDIDEDDFDTTSNIVTPDDLPF